MNLRTRPVRLLVAAAALLLVALAAVPGAAAEEPEARPVLLLIHGGGFYEGSPGQMDYAARIAAAEGTFATRQPAYPLDDLAGAFERVRVVAQRLRAQGREVYAYGDSAGGAIAVWLASHGFARAVAAKAPPTALVGWRAPITARYASAPVTDPRSWRHLKATRSVRRAYSPALRRSLRPVLIFQSCADTIVPCEMNAGFARRDPLVAMERIWGPHRDADAKAYSFRAGLAWLARRAAG